MISNMESSIRALKLAQKEGYNDFKAKIKTINTGSYVYTIYGEYEKNRGILISVVKRRPKNKLAEETIIYRFMACGLGWDHCMARSLPESVIKTIKDFVVAYNK